MGAKTKPTSTKIEVDTYKVLSECIERGIVSGYNKAHQHTKKPEQNELFNQIHHYCMLEICEYFKFD